MHNYSAYTVASAAAYLGYFLDWCRERGMRARGGHAPGAGALSALGVPLPQGERPAAGLPHAEHAPGGVERFLSVDGAAQHICCTIRRANWYCRASSTACPRTC